MTWVLFSCAVIFLTLGHLLKARRWQLFARTYESVGVMRLTNALSLGYLVDFYLPFRLGDIVRSAVAGRRMTNGWGFALATVIVDRVLDVLAVAVMFCVMGIAVGGDPVLGAMGGYLLSAGVLIVLCAAGLFFNQVFKRAALSVSSLFNDRIKFRMLFFSWSLISSFKDIFHRVSKPAIFLRTALMWGAYLASYACMAGALTGIGDATGLVDVLLLMFRPEGLLRSTFMATSSVLGAGSEVMFSAYILAPLPLLFLGSLVFVAKGRKAADSPAKLLPQLKPDEQLHFLTEYFSGRERKALQEYITMNGDVGILRDYTSGSDATTMLCVSEDKTVFRKYAFGAGVEKLREQARWIKDHVDRLSLPRIVREKEGEGSFCYDMAYDAQGVDFFQYIYSNPIEKGWAVLEMILNDVKRDLHTPAGGPVSRADMEEYIGQKVAANLKTISQSRALESLTKSDYITINGVRMRNLPLLLPMLREERLKEVFSGDRTGDIHGDLTLQNMICTVGQGQKKPYYLIDPNPTGPVLTANMDYAKVLQSLHGRYEFLEQSLQAKVTGDSIDLFLPESSQYAQMYRLFTHWMERELTGEDIRSAYYHEIIHWLRLLPYRVRRSETTAARYYAALIMVMNDVYHKYEEA